MAVPLDRRSIARLLQPDIELANALPSADVSSARNPWANRIDGWFGEVEIGLGVGGILTNLSRAEYHGRASAAFQPLVAAAQG